MLLTIEAEFFFPDQNLFDLCAEDSDIDMLTGEEWKKILGLDAMGGNCRIGV